MKYRRRYTGNTLKFARIFSITRRPVWQDCFLGAADKLPLITGWSRFNTSTTLALKLFGPCERDNGYHQSSPN